MSVQTQQTKSEATTAEKRAGKYLTFGIGAEEYGFEILKVREIIGIMEITSVPRMPDYVEGVINLRGKVIPVIDLRLKFGMIKADRTSETCIIVVDVKGSLMGVLVDRVSEVLDIRGTDIEDAPKVGIDMDTTFIHGMAKVKGSVKILLSIDKVLSDSDHVDLGALIENANNE
jgi:purine-binding chemotaxis protein CheW